MCIKIRLMDVDNYPLNDVAPKLEENILTPVENKKIRINGSLVVILVVVATALWSWQWFSSSFGNQLSSNLFNNQESSEKNPQSENVENNGDQPGGLGPLITEEQVFNIPTAKTIPGGTHAFQTFNNCGPAALSMALSHFGITETQQTLGISLRPYQNPQGNNDDKSVTLREVATKAEEFGLTSYLRPAGNIAIIEAFIAEDIPVIARTWLEPNEDIGHFRVVKGYDQANQILIQDDSLQGKDLAFSYDEFEELWSTFNYEFLVLVPAEKQAVSERILGGLANEQQAWQSALALAEEQLTDDPSDIYAAFNKSVALYYLGRYQESVEAYEEVENRLPSRMLWYQLEPVLAYYQLGDYARVNQIADRILANQNRAYSELYYLKGLIYQQQGQEAAATTAFNTAEQYNNSDYWKVNVDVLIL